MGEHNNYCCNINIFCLEISYATKKSKSKKIISLNIEELQRSDYKLTQYIVIDLASANESRKHKK
jgi:hypothetical protein